MNPFKWLQDHEVVRFGGAVIAAGVAVSTYIQSSGWSWNMLIAVVPLAISEYERAMVSSRATTNDES